MLTNRETAREAQDILFLCAFYAFSRLFSFPIVVADSINIILKLPMFQFSLPLVPFGSLE